MRKEFDGVRNLFASSGWDVTSEAPEVVECGANVPSYDSVVVSGSTLFWIFVDKDFCPKWRQGCTIVVKVTKDCGIC